jgi:hypothetical protein
MAWLLFQSSLVILTASKALKIPGLTSCLIVNINTEDCIYKLYFEALKKPANKAGSLFELDFRGKEN